MTYNFKADPSGSTFWHAHFHSENVDGLFGPLVVEDEPESFPFQYDYEHVILMTDTYNKTSWALEESIFTAAEPPSPDPTPSEGLICVYDETAIPATPSCSSTVSGEGFNLNFEPGKIYRLRLICAADLAPFLFSIDEHELQVVSADYFTLDGTAWVNAVPIQVFMVAYRLLPSLILGIRLVNDTMCLFALEKTYERVQHSGYGLLCNLNVVSILRYRAKNHSCYCTGPLLGELNADVRGTVKYGKGLPASPPESTSWNATNAACVDLDYSILKSSPTPFVSPIQKPALTTYLNYTFPTTVNGVARTFVNNNLYNVSDDAYPTLFQFNEDPSWRPNKPGENRNLIIIPDDIRGKDVRILVHSSGFPGTHPFHAHGGGFKVVAFGTGNFTDEDLGRVDEIDVRQVIERDTVIVPSLGWVMIQCVYTFYLSSLSLNRRL